MQLLQPCLECDEVCLLDRVLRWRRRRRVPMRRLLLLLLLLLLSNGILEGGPELLLQLRNPAFELLRSVQNNTHDSP